VRWIGRAFCAGTATCFALAGAAACGRFDEGSAAVTNDAASPDAPIGDAQSSSSDGAVDPCAGAFLCDSFERTTPVDQGWDPTTPPTNASLEITTAEHLTGTRALVASLVANDPAATNFRTGHLRRDLSASQVVVRFGVKTPKAPLAGVNIVTLKLADGRRVSVNYQPSGRFRLYEQRDSATGGPAADVGTDVGTADVARWRTIQLEVAGQAATLTVDAEPPVTLTLTLGTPQPIAEVSVGAVFSPISAQTDTYFFDDIVIEKE
jgi:hypothetical protein